jgi:Macrocin-O-methyltransferase (TylF)
VAAVNRKLRFLVGRSDEDERLDHARHCNDLLKTITLLRYLTVNMLSLQLLKRMWWKLHEWKKPASVQNRRGKRRRTLGKLVFGTVGKAFNRAGSMFILSYRPDFDYDHRQFPDYETFLRYWRLGNEVNNGGDLSRLYLLYLNARRVIEEGVVGDFVELGVYKGNSAKILCEIAKRDNRRTILFDTFSGFDEADVGIGNRSMEKAFSDTSLEAVQRFVGEDKVVYAQGRFPETIDKLPKPMRISLAHLDCDLYQPMKAGLQAFYSIMSPGGIFIIHDYSSGWWSRDAMRATDEFLADKPERLVLMPDKSGTAIFRKL